jgi:dihydrodipicolinate synthase/N-acetylneuraminate lyase
MGSNGEAISLERTEKLELLRNVRKMASPKSKLIAGLGMNSK